MTDNTIALVTGASRGIGQAIAEELARTGYKVVGTATSQSGADRISARLSELGNAGGGEVLDIADAEAVNTALKRITEHYGQPLVLVNNAGITRDNIMLRMNEDEWGSVIDTNLSGVYRVCKGCLKGMTKARQGRIINISSVVGSMGNAGQANYAAAKAGVEGFTRSLAQELGQRNITVNAVAPGFIQTDMTDALSDEQRETMLARIPLGRLGRPEEVARAVVWLAGEDAGYITGTTLHVNGGLLME